MVRLRLAKESPEEFRDWGRLQRFGEEGFHVCLLSIGGWEGVVNGAVGDN